MGSHIFGILGGKNIPVIRDREDLSRVFRFSKASFNVLTSSILKF